MVQRALQRTRPQLSVCGLCTPPLIGARHLISIDFPFGICVADVPLWEAAVRVLVNLAGSVWQGSVRFRRAVPFLPRRTSDSAGLSASARASVFLQRHQCRRGCPGRLQCVRMRGR